ncbi:glycosyltransferase family 4 protein [Leptolyngbya sp. 15MV]|nr:glycosyltransferase family 4 protein [Leptolyngbya sp. 15MV]
MSRPDDKRGGGRVLYVGARVPALSETFVTREVLGLRSRGVAVAVASVRPPERIQGDAALLSLADEAIGVYGPGPAAMLWDAAVEALGHPARAARTVLRAIGDAFSVDAGSAADRAKSVLHMAAGLALARRARPIGVTRVHAHMAHGPTTIAMYAAMELGVAFSFTGHANDLFVRARLMRAKLRRCAAVMCISRWHEAYYERLEPSCAPKRRMVRCGVEVPEGRARGSGGDGPRVMGLARLVPKKGFDLLVEAMARLRARGVPATATIIGDGPERERLETMIEQKGLRGVVELAGARPNAEALAMLDGADVFALPCRVATGGDRDGIPVSLMEAMARGICVVAGRVEPIDELVKDGETGVLVEQGDSEALAAAIERLWRDAALRRRLGDAGREWVRREFSIEVNLNRLIGALDLPMHGTRARC